MPYGAWPPLSVRDWQSVLAQREPDFGSEDEDFDGILAASASRRIHELRGVIVGQVAEIENLLLYISKQVSERYGSGDLSNRRVRGTAGTVLAHVEVILQTLGLGDEFENHLKVIKETIKRRNAVVHAVVLVGISYCQFNDSREPMLILIKDNDEKRWEARLEAATDLDPWQTEEMFSGDISEIDLERQLDQAYEALERCLDIWVRVDQLLPNLARDI